MNKSTSLNVFVAVCLVTAGIASGAARAGDMGAPICDISDLPCWADDSDKCNIKFRNKTGIASGTSAGGYSQRSEAQTIRVLAIDKAGDRIGNTVTIDAGSSGTLNLEKKDKFAKIFITPKVVIGDKADTEGVTMGCQNIRATLQGSGKCNVFVFKPMFTSSLGYACNSKSVTGP